MTNDRIRSIVNEIGPELDELSKNIFDNPEMGNEEVKACAWHCALLEKYGFTVERNYCEQPTGFKATFDSGKPGRVVAYLAEYDCLPGIGHGCGHNILGATSTGAGIVLSKLIDEVGGKVIVFGTPAEETSGAKVVYAAQGKFNDLDFAMIVHPGAKFEKSGSSLALAPIEFEFFGKTAHAASAPWMGINALDGAVNTINLINAMREHILPTSRVHGIVVKGGEAANIVPEYASLQYYVRSNTKGYNEQLLERVKNCARAGALAAGCRMEMNEYEFPYDNLVTNHTLADTFYDAMKDIAGVEFEEPRTSMGSSDIGQVSQCCPAIHPYFALTEDPSSITGHSREMANATLTDYAKDSMRKTIAGLVLAAMRIMQDDELYAKMRDEFDKAEK